MTANEALQILKKAGVPDYYYKIGRPVSTECIVLEERKENWVIYIWERGQEWFTEYYKNEDIAAQEFVRRVIRTGPFSIS